MASIDRLFQKQGGRCCYCDGATRLPKENKARAMQRLGILPGLPGSGKLLRDCMATREHLVRVVDGGKSGDNLKMACHACNGRRNDATPEQHRIDMQTLVRDGLHPTNRGKLSTDYQTHRKLGLKAHKDMRQRRLKQEEAPCPTI